MGKGKGQRWGRAKVDGRYRGQGHVVFHMDGTEVTLRHMPYIDGWVCRGGVHGDVGYNRNKEKRELRRRIDEG